jgi:hypothetical protein
MLTEFQMFLRRITRSGFDIVRPIFQIGKGNSTRGGNPRRFGLKSATRNITMSAMTSWAYEFRCQNSLHEMERALNQSGPWEWRVRDCAWYPDFLQCRPQSGARICLYEIKPPGGAAGYRCQVEAGSKEGVDPILKEALGRLPIEGLKEIEAGEWPFD